MNLELLRTFDHSYPEHNEGILDSGSEAVVCQFNRRGTLLAVGCNDGRIALWDFMTRGIARQLSGHIHPITSLSWTRSGRKLASAASDWNVILWDVYTGEPELRMRFPSPVSKVQYHPRDRHVMMVCPLKNAPTLVTLKEGKDPAHSQLPTCGEPESNMSASFDRKGELVVLGSSKGKVILIDYKTLTVLKYFRVCSSSSSAAVTIKSIEFPRRGTTFLLNGSDRVMRVYDIEDIKVATGEGRGLEVEAESLQRFQDNVNRTQWRKCVFSGDGDYICAGSHRQHELYVWDKSTGNLVKILTGPKGECLLDLVWHPVRATILSVSNGVVNVWTHKHKELWSAYAPNFKELDENEEYEERESEFDVEDEDTSVGGDDQTDIVTETDIDVTDTPTIPAYCSSEEDSEDPLDWLPFAPEVEEPDEMGWGQLEPGLNELPGEGKSPKKRPVTDENLDPTHNPDHAHKKLKVVDMDLPEATDGCGQDHAPSSNNNKGKKKDSGKTNIL